MSSRMNTQVRQYGLKQRSAYSEYYQQDDYSFKKLLERIKVAIKSRYRIFMNKSLYLSEWTDETRQQLIDAGLNGFDMIKPETFYISKIIDRNEKIKAAICGRIDDGSGVLLVITNSRIIFLNQIPLFTTIKEISYLAVKAVSIDIGQFDATIYLYTDVDDFKVHHVNLNSANKFVDVAGSIVMGNSRVNPIKA